SDPLAAAPALPCPPRRPREPAAAAFHLGQQSPALVRPGLPGARSAAPPDGLFDGQAGNRLQPRLEARDRAPVGRLSHLAAARRAGRERRRHRLPDPRPRRDRPVLSGRPLFTRAAAACAAPWAVAPLAVRR